MNAQEMFEELGYKFNEDEIEIMYSFPKYYDGYYLRIVFDKIMSSYKVTKLNHSTSIGIKLHQAITQQMKELGWIE